MALQLACLKASNPSDEGANDQAGSDDLGGRRAAGGGGTKSGDNGGETSRGPAGNAQAGSEAAGGARTGAGGGGGIASEAGRPGPGDLVIDDFEDGDGDSLQGNTWYTYTDVDSGGQSTLALPPEPSDGAIMTGEGFQSSRSMSVKVEFNKGQNTYDPYVGFGVHVASPDGFERFSGISYTYKGAAHTVRLETSDVTDYDYHLVRMAASSSWKTVKLAYSVFAQSGFGKAVPFDLQHLQTLSWNLQGTSGKTVTFALDNVWFVASGSTTPTKDMEIRDAKPPAKATIASVAISNPLQEVARRYLDKGFNLSNWLEQDKFSEFTYDESYVQAAARAGFKSVRVPIDVDRYVSDAGSERPTVDGDLFRVLDALDGWTRAAGLGLTIDYHQYDRSLDVTQPESVRRWVQSWSVVAEHFAQSPRKDLFYELLNEPELSATQAHPPTAAEWTAMALEGLAAIREKDPTRPVIFGDVEFYGITPLAKRTPLADPNVIYAFHFYEPMVFTHQGADWAGMGSTKNVPYPYSPDRWSTSYADFGFTPYQESWQLSQLRGYYATGNSAAMYNRIVEAKRWAVSNNVPVICNEFGAYDRSALREDRLRYHTDLIKIFAELEIPWQVWFTLIDRTTGTMAPEDRVAFGLTGDTPGGADAGPKDASVPADAADGG